jgi:outer membrane protein, multidrug efflux system
MMCVIPALSGRAVPEPRQGRTVWMALVLCGVLAGCASRGASLAAPTPTDVPLDWAAGATTGVAPRAAGAAPTDLTRWWAGFADAGLSASVEQALRANTGVRSAQAAMAQARAVREGAVAATSPTLGLSASAQRSRAGSAAAGNSFKAGFDAGWEPDVFGRLASAVGAAEADLRATAAALEGVRVSLAAEVAATYIELRGLQARLVIARSNLAAQDETLQITAWRVQAGLASSLDLEQARAAAEQTRAQIPSLQASLGKAAHALAVLTGRPPGATDAWLAQAAPVPQAPQSWVLAFPAETLRQRPDVRQAEQRVLAALARVRQADAGRYPSFRLAGSLGLSAPRLSELLEPGGLTRSLLAGLSASLWDGGAAQAQLRAQQAVLEQARVGYEASLLAALQEVEDALVALAGDRERLVRLQAAAEAAANAELLARQRYASGLIDFRTVLDTQRTLLSAQSELAATQAALSTDHVRLYKALGGGWTPQVVTPDGSPS